MALRSFSAFLVWHRPGAHSCTNAIQYQHTQTVACSRNGRLVQNRQYQSLLPGNVHIESLFQTSERMDGSRCGPLGALYFEWIVAESVDRPDRPRCVVLRSRERTIVFGRVFRQLWCRRVMLNVRTVSVECVYGSDAYLARHLIAGVLALA